MTVVSNICDDVLAGNEFCLDASLQSEHDDFDPWTIGQSARQMERHVAGTRTLKNVRVSRLPGERQVSCQVNSC